MIPDSNLKRIRELEKTINDLRDQMIFVPPTNDLSLSFGNLGSRNASHGVLVGGEALQPIVHLLTDVDTNGVSTGDFNRINLMSSNAIVDRTGFTNIELKYIQKTSNDGQRIGALTVAAGKTLTLQTGGNMAITSDIILDENTLVYLVYSSDLGNKYRVLTSSSGGGGGSDTPWTVDHVASGFSLDKLGWLGSNSTVHADSGLIRTANNTIGLSWRNAANTGNLELKVDTTNFFDFTHSANGNVTLALRAQHAVDPDAILYITQNAGSAGDTIFRAPYTGKFQSGAFVDVFNYTTARIQTEVNIIPSTDGTLNLGGGSNRFNQVHASTFMFDGASGLYLAFSTLGLDVEVGNGDYIKFFVNTVEKVRIEQSSSILFGNWTVGNDLDIAGDLTMNGVGSNITNVGDVSSTTLNISGLAAFNGAVNLGNALADAIVVNGRFSFSNVATNPSSNGEMFRNSTDVKVFSGGSLKNFTQMPQLNSINTYTNANIFNSIISMNAPQFLILNANDTSDTYIRQSTNAGVTPKKLDLAVFADVIFQGIGETTTARSRGMFKAMQKAGDIIASELPSGYACAVKNTSSGQSYMAYNDGGTIKKAFFA